MSGVKGHSGGLRVGAGRRPKNEFTRWLDGNAGKRGQKEKTAPVAPVLVPVEPPSDLGEAELMVWKVNAPHAVEARTLTPGTVEAFRELCQAIVRERLLWAQIHECGLQYVKILIDGAGVEHRELKANPLLGHHRGMLQRVEAGRRAFQLAPVGKAILPPAKPEDPFDEFDDSSTH